jgi:hypothetical protein
LGAKAHLNSPALCAPNGVWAFLYPILSVSPSSSVLLVMRRVHCGVGGGGGGDGGLWRASPCVYAFMYMSVFRAALSHPYRALCAQATLDLRVPRVPWVDLVRKGRRGASCRPLSGALAILRAWVCSFFFRGRGWFICSPTTSR